MPFMNFKIVNAKTSILKKKTLELKNLTYLFTKILIISWHTLM